MRRFIVTAALATVLAGCSAIPQMEAARRAPVAHSTAVISPRPELRQCLAGLGASQANFTPLPDRYFGAGCSTVGTVHLASLRSDDAALTLSNLGPVACPLAETFAAWARFGVDRAARQILGSPLMRIETFGSYSCRNIAGSDQRSAHATANAIDIAAFVLADGRRISVLSGWAAGSVPEQRFLGTIHTSACRRFGTVLGPGYNAAHRDHLHLELSVRAFCR